MDDKNLLVTSTPHQKATATVPRIMKAVILALIPASAASVYFFGLRALLIICISVLSCIAFEALFQKIIKKPVSICDYSAAVTGLLLALNLPASSPIWLPVVGSFFAIVIVKQLFGGLGQNFMNPALAARAFLLTAYPSIMVKWTAPVNNPFGLDAVTTATPLGILKETGAVPVLSDYIHALVGNIGGSLGETCSLAILAGGVFLILIKVISWRIPAAYLGSAFLCSWVLGRMGFLTGLPFYELIIGGLMLGAFFMATDYTTSPVTPKGQAIMGVGCGLLTIIIRVYGGYPEGVTYSILLMNLAVPLIDKYTRPRVYGVTKQKKAKRGESRA